MLLFSYLSAVLLHECGHLTALLYYRAHIKALRVSPFGLTISHTPLPSALAEFIVAACGPLFGIIGYIAAHYSASLPIFSAVSLLLSLFNLLPIASLDGSRMLSSLLSRHFPPQKKDRITAAVSSLALLGLWLVGVYLFFILDEGPSLFLMALTLFFQEMRQEDA